jgi:predicted porin
MWDWNLVQGRTAVKRREFQFTEGEPGNYIVYTDKVNTSDNWGAKAKITYSNGPFNWYSQGAAMGLVANGGADNTKTFTGWRLRIVEAEIRSFLSGFTYTIGDFKSLLFYIKTYCSSDAKRCSSTWKVKKYSRRSICSGVTEKL